MELHHNQPGLATPSTIKEPELSKYPFAKLPEQKKSVCAASERALKNMRKSKKIYLPEDLIISILVKLQVKPLMRFRGVCKWWYHLIKSPNFIEMHQRSNQNKKNESILIQRVRDVDHKTELSLYSYESLNELSPPMKVPHINDNKDFMVSWPCNGLLLCIYNVNDDCTRNGVLLSISDINDDDRSISVLFNPSTRESKLLPPIPFHVRGDRLCGSLIGLGYDSNQNDYKVVSIKYDDTAQIYNLRSNSWRQIKHDMPYISSTDAGVPLNGALHWSAHRDGSNIIFSFDVSTEVFQDINLPEDLAHNRSYTPGTVTLLNDCLAMFTFDYDDSPFVDIWVMKVGSWKQMRIGPVDDILVFPFLFWKNEALFCHDYDLGHEKLKLLALDTHEMTETGIVSKDCEEVMLYKESLVSIN